MRPTPGAPRVPVAIARALPPCGASIRAAPRRSRWSASWSSGSWSARLGLGASRCSCRRRSACSHELVDMLRSGELSVHLAASLKRLVLGLRRRRRGRRRGRHRGRLLLDRRGGGHAADRGDVPHPEDRAAAAPDPLARDRRGLEGGGHRARRLLPDGHQHVHGRPPGGPARWCARPCRSARGGGA